MVGGRPDNIKNNWRVTKTCLRLGSRIIGKCMMICENPTGIRSREWFDLGLTNLKLYAKIKRCKKIIGPINETLLPLWNMSKKHSRVGFQKDHGWKKAFEVFELEI